MWKNPTRQKNWAFPKGRGASFRALGTRAALSIGIAENLYQQALQTRRTTAKGAIVPGIHRAGSKLSATSQLLASLRGGHTYGENPKKRRVGAGALKGPPLGGGDRGPPWQKRSCCFTHGGCQRETAHGDAILLPGEMIQTAARVTLAQECDWASLPK